MILSGISVIILFIMLIAHEFDLKNSGSNNSYIPLPSMPTVYKGSRQMSKSAAASTSGRSNSIHIGHNDLSRLIRHLNGEFVFPPPSEASQVHHRNTSLKGQFDSSYWTKKFDTESTRSSVTVLRPLEEERPQFVIE